VNYGITMQEIAEELVARGQPQRAYQFVKKIREFDVRDEVRYVFLINLDAFAIQAGAYDEADTYFAEAVEEFGDVMGADVFLRRGILFYNAGELRRADEEFKKTFARTMNRANPDFQTLARMVVFHLEIGDTARAREIVDGWDRMFPGQDITFRLYLDYVKDPRAALRVLNTIIQRRPQDLELLILRDSLIETYDLR
jgi:tetratricopeptide (TPR) repeat protein